MADEKDSYCIMVHYGWVRCNRHWILCEKHGMIHVWKVVDGAVVEPGLCFSDLEGKTVDVIEFSPLCDDTVIVTFGVGSIPASIFCIDLAASFRSRELVIVSKFPCRAKKFPLGVLQMPDGSMATVNSHKSKPFYLVECTTGDSHEFREGTGDVTPIGKCHALVVSQEMDDQKFEVYHTSDLATPTFCVPGTWACPHGGSGLIVSTTHRLLKDNHCNEAPFLVHDGVTGFKIGDFYLNSHFYVPNHTVWCMSL
ncbi:hypothetical protein Pelo_9781 [Pelomyxa schiedti]|nr:hypothetical protein Pelo_9781 [Pelomyxa schiedti]